MAGETKRPIKRPVWPKRAIVTCGMPYGNKGLHFGHIGGVFIPADAYARFLRDRIGADNVILVSGTDCYGSPIAEAFRKLQEEGYQGSIEEYIEAPRSLAPAARALAIASCSAWWVGEVSWVYPRKMRPSAVTITAPTQ